MSFCIAPVVAALNPLVRLQATGSIPLTDLNPHVLIYCSPTISGQQSLYKDDTHLVPVTANNDKVGAITNFGLDGDFFQQASDPNKPLYKTDGTLNWVEASSSFLDLASTTTGKDLYVAAAFMPLTTSDFERLVAVSTAAQNDFDSPLRCIPALRRGSDATWGAFCNGTILSVADISNGTACVIESIFSTGQHVFSLNGVDSSPVASAHDLSADLFRILEGTGGSPSPTNSKLYSLFARRGALPSPTERAEIRTVLGATAGL